MHDEEVLDAHLQQLRDSVSPAFSLLAGVSDPALRREAARLVDFLLAERFAAPSSLSDPPDAIPALRAGLQAAYPDRRTVHYILETFTKWVAAVDGDARAAFLEHFPKLAPATRDLGEEGMRLLLEAAASDTRILAPVAAYAMTTAAAVRAMARMARRAATHRRVELLEALAAAFPASRMEESRDAEFLLPALERMTEASQAWPEAMRLAVALLERNISSARAAAVELATLLGKLPAARHAPFLDDFRLLVDWIGIRAIGFGLKTLPGLYDKHGIESTRRFVSLAGQAAQLYGVLAGEAFLERKTQAAREALL